LNVTLIELTNCTLEDSSVNVVDHPQLHIKTELLVMAVREGALAAWAIVSRRWNVILPVEDWPPSSWIFSQCGG
jgi:hypothetical protein